MAKRDLFELLQVRHRAGKTTAKRTPERVDPIAGLRNWFGRVVGGGGKAGKASKPARKQPPGRSLVFSAGGLGLVLIATLMVGFFLGRGLAPRGGTEDLRSGPQKQPEQPGWLGPAKAAEEADGFTPEKEVETLSQSFFVVLHFADSERERASRLAGFLRRGGLDTTRIKLLPTRNGGHRWATVVYATQEDSDGVRAKLQSIEPPPFEPTYSKRVAKTLALQQLASKSD